MSGGVSTPATPYNPTPTTWRVPGEGSYLSVLPSPQRLSMGLGSNDINRIIGDTTNRAYQIWNGTRFTDMNNEFVDVRMYGAVGDGYANDTQALKNALDSGCKNIYFPKGYTFRLSNVDEVYAPYYVDIPDGVVFKIDGTLIGTAGKSITFNILGSFGAFGTGTIQIAQGGDARVFLFRTGVVWFRGLTFKGIAPNVNPWYLVCTDPGSGTLDSLTIVDCRFINYCGYGYLREVNSAVASTHSVAETIIANCYFETIYNGAGVLINATNGRDRSISLIGNVFKNVIGDVYGASFAGFPIAIAGYGSLVNPIPFVPSSAAANILVANNNITSARTGIHFEYCNNIISAGNVVNDIKDSYYPVGTESNGIVFYGCSNWLSLGDCVRGVTGDNIYAYGFRASGGYSGGYQQSNRDFAIKSSTLEDASFFIEQQVPVNAISGVPAYEMTTSSVCNFEGNSTIRGCARFQVTGTLDCKDNNLVAPLSSSALTVLSYYRNANFATLSVKAQNNNVGIFVEDVAAIVGVGSGFDAQYATITNVVYYGNQGPYSVTTVQRAANVATLTLTGNITVPIGAPITVAGVGSGFDVTNAVVTANTPGALTSTVSYANVGANTGPSAGTGTLTIPFNAQITYSNTGANVATTAATAGTVLNMVKALTIDAKPNYTGNSDYDSYYRLNMEVTGNTAKTVYGGSSFSLRNVTQYMTSAGTFAANGRLPANLNINFIANNFGADFQAASTWPVNNANRVFYTAQTSVPTGVEFCVGDQCSINIGGGGAHKNYICSAGGYVGVLADTFTIVSATAGTLKKAGAYSWVTYPPIYSLGEEIQVTNGTNTLIGICTKIQLSGADQIMTLVDPATGSALDLTPVSGGVPAIQPYRVASFVLF